jgi:hypothetical protein
MKPYFKGFEINGKIRTQPWTTSERDENEKYHDFRSYPALVSEVLEDYKIWDHHDSVKRFYELIEWINSENSSFESNDCAFKGPSENNQREKFNKKLVCSGRLMLFFRSLELNLSIESEEFAARSEKTPTDYSANLLFEWLVNRSLQLIGPLDSEAIWTCLALEIYTAFYTNAPVREDKKFGHQVSYEFWAWGDDEQETMQNLGIAVETLSRCLRILSGEVPQALRSLQAGNTS